MVRPFFANGILAKGSIIPQMDWGDHDAGVNLNGTGKLVVHARAVDDEAAYIEFKMRIIDDFIPVSE